MILTDVGYHVKALCLIYSQRLLNYLPFNLFNMSVTDEYYFRNALTVVFSLVNLVYSLQLIATQDFFP